MDADKLVALGCHICVEFGSSLRKTFEAQEINYGNSSLSHEMPHIRLGFSGERHNALTASATCVLAEFASLVSGCVVGTYRSTKFKSAEGLIS